MAEPKRWLQDEGAPREIVDLLRAAQRPRPASAAKRIALVGVLTTVAEREPVRRWWGWGWLRAALSSVTGS